MSQKKIKYYKFLYSIIILASFIFLIEPIKIYAEVFSTPSLSKPSAPGTFGARGLDWSASDVGEVSYNIPIQVPALRQLDIGLNLKYSSTNAYGEAGPFWGFTLPKVTLDIKRGTTKFILRTSCQTSNADNLYLNGNRMIPLGNGVWASNLNSARDLLRCAENGFTYFKSNGEILHFGLTQESQVEDGNGKTIEWYLSKKSTFQGKQEIKYNYVKPIIESSVFGFDKDNKFNFISKPLLSNIVADDVLIQINYKENTFKNPHFLGGFAQIVFGRIDNIIVKKNQKNVRSYKLEYENNTATPFPRLSTVQEIGSDNVTKLPKTIISYRGENSSTPESFEAYNETYDYSLRPLREGHTKFADILGNGRTQAITQAGRSSFWLDLYDPTQVFLPENKGELKSIKQYSIEFDGEVSNWTSTDIENISFIDFSGSGVMDLFSSAGDTDVSPAVIFNDRKIDAEGNLSLSRFATFSRNDLFYMRGCERDARKWKTLDLSGNGRTDFLCLASTGIHILFNKDIKVDDPKINSYEIVAEQFHISSDFTLRRVKPEEVAVVDWNADGLPDLLVIQSSKILLYLNNGRLAKGERTGKFFEAIDLGIYPDLYKSNVTNVAIGDFNGTGFPSISIDDKNFLINNGLGKPLTLVSLENSVYFNPAHTAVVQFTGTGKQQIIGSTPAANGNVIFEFSSRSFPNLLHSIVTADGRFLSFNYSSTVLENNEAVTYDQDPGIKNFESRLPLIPVVIPVLKQVGVSDGINPMRMWRYSYRMPNFDKTLKKFLGFSLVRKQTVGDKSQAGTLIEQRFLSGYRFSVLDRHGGGEDFRLNAEKDAFHKGVPLECSDKYLTSYATLWCTDLAGYNYYKKTGTAFDGLSFATGKLNDSENYTVERNSISIKFLDASFFSGSNKKELAQILADYETSGIHGAKFLNNNIIINKITNIFDNYGRVISKIKSNSPVLNGDDHVTSYSYFCPMSHQENPKIFCDSAELIQTSSSLGSVKQTSQKIIFDNMTGLPLEEWVSTQSSGLAIQATAKYDSYGRIVNLNKATGESSFFEWEEGNANLKSILDQDNIKTSALYNDLGYITKVENTRGSASQFTYDSIGRILSTSKNLGGNAPLSIIHTVQNTWDIFINWLKSIFGLESAKNENNANDNSIFNAIVNNDLIEFEKYEYVFPFVKINSGKSLEEEVKIWNLFDSNLPIIPTADSYNETTLGKFSNSQIIPGSVSIYRRNNEKEALSLISKTWLSGNDEALFVAAKLDGERYSIANKSSINSLGNIQTEYLSSEASLADVMENKLPNSSTFKVKSIYSYFANGKLATEEFDTGVVQKFVQGVDYDEAVSPEGRKSRNIYNQLGQVAVKQIGLDVNGNISNETLITNIAYDALGRISALSNNDGLEAWQTFAANGAVDSQSNNALGVSRYFYDNFGRLSQSALCPVGSDPENCNVLTASVLYKSYSYNAKGKLDKEEHTRFNRENGTHSKETINYVFGSTERNDRTQDIGLPIAISVASLSDLGLSQSVRKFAHNREGVVASEELELFLGAQQKNNLGENIGNKSIGVYQVERITDLAGNLVQLRSRGGFSREVLNKLKANHFTGYAASYEAGTSELKNLSFLQNGVAQSVPLQKISRDAQGYTKKITLENNLELQACWHNRKEVPLSFWAGNSNTAPSELCANEASQNKGLFHSKWEYDNDLFPISATDLSGYIAPQAALSSNSLFTYDRQGRLSSTKGVGDEKSSWGSIEYNYSVGGKINKITRSGNFIKNRISSNSNSLIDTYSYSHTGMLGVLNSVTSTDGNETALQTFASDSIGFRKFGVSPTLAVFTPGNTGQTVNSNYTNNNGSRVEVSSLVNSSVPSWKNKAEIPMQKYVWNGRGQLAGVFSGTLENNANNISTNELLNYRMSDESGGLLSEFDGVEFLEFNKESSENNASTSKNGNIKLNKLPRFVAVAEGVSFERDEIHFNINLGSFANLRLITRYPTLNAQDPTSISAVTMQTRKELVIKDHVASVSQVIDITTHKIVERNANEPFGLARGIPLLSNSVLSNYKNQGKRADVNLYTNEQSNMRDNWEEKSFELLSSINSIEMQGMRGTTVFATGKFSASTGLSNMGVRTLDSARGVWLSPDLFMGRSLEDIVKSPIEANLFQYANNNPITNNDPTGMRTFESDPRRPDHSPAGRGIRDSNNSSKGNDGRINSGGKYDLGLSFKSSSLVERNRYGLDLQIGKYSFGGFGKGGSYWENGTKYNSQGHPISEVGLGNEGFDLLLDTTQQVTMFYGLKSVALGAIKEAWNYFSNGAVGENSAALCFVSGTLVTTEAGAKEIQDIRPGDKIAAKNPDTGEIEYKTVLQTFAHEEEQVVTLNVGNSNITSTPEHPYYVVGQGYTPANLIFLGQQVLTTYGTSLPVMGVKVSKQKQMVYNFEVEDFHNYFVSDDGILVHNACDVRQMHHYATNKHKDYKQEFEKIAGKYGLDLDGNWNKELLPHQGRHPKEYHEFVFDGMKLSDEKANGNVNKFLSEFERNVKAPVRAEPDMLRKSWWRNQ